MSKGRTNLTPWAALSTYIQIILFNKKSTYSTNICCWNVYVMMRQTQGKVLET